MGPHGVHFPVPPQVSCVARHRDERSGPADSCRYRGMIVAPTAFIQHTGGSS